MENINSILENFILQSKTNNLKVLNYPKIFADLKMKVSFGQGVPARVSWISFLAQEMQTSNGFYPVYLFLEYYFAFISLSYYKDLDLDYIWDSAYFHTAYCRINTVKISSKNKKISYMYSTNVHS